jgi:ketosteroid isomerase-like protein
MNNVQVIIAFNEALNKRDLDTMMLLMTQDCLFENTSPAPDGTRYQGQAALRAFWENFFSTSSQATITIEDIFELHHRCVMLWRYDWVDLQGKAGFIRGVDIYRLENGLIAEKLSYVKG